MSAAADLMAELDQTRETTSDEAVVEPSMSASEFARESELQQAREVTTSDHVVAEPSASATELMGEPQLRQRRVVTTSDEVVAEPPKSATELAREEDEMGIGLLEILRTICLLFLLGFISYWFITRDSSGLVGSKRPKVLRRSYWENLFAEPIQLTDDELKAYDGSDPAKPIYLAINGTIYDVSNGRNFYGPGGSYHFFAGADASRSFITSCFQEDITPDIRNVELMFMPKSTAEIDALFTSGEMKIRLEQERRKARERAHLALKHWVNFFEKSPKYNKVGTVKREEDWEMKKPMPTLCAAAEQQRPTREPPVREPPVEGRGAGGQ